MIIHQEDTIPEEEVAVVMVGVRNVQLIKSPVTFGNSIFDSILPLKEVGKNVNFLELPEISGFIHFLLQGYGRGRDDYGRGGGDRYQGGRKDSRERGRDRSRGRRYRSRSR